MLRLDESKRIKVSSIILLCLCFTSSVEGVWNYMSNQVAWNVAWLIGRQMNTSQMSKDKEAQYEAYCTYYVIIKLKLYLVVCNVVI